jgi:hypothetical protein
MWSPSVRVEVRLDEVKAILGKTVYRCRYGDYSLFRPHLSGETATGAERAVPTRFALDLTEQRLMSQTTDQARGRTSGGPSLGKKKTRTGSTGSTFASSVPAPPKRRRPALTALAVLLIVGGAALAGLLAVRMDSREPVLVVRADISGGQQITEQMLKSANVSGVDASNSIPVDAMKSILGTYARQTIYKDQLLSTNLLRKDPPLEVDQAQVGVPLTSGKFPPGLRSGDAVRMVRIGDAQSPSRALCTGLVLRVGSSKSGGFGSDAKTSVATVLVPQAVVDDVLGATGDDQLGIALIGRGIAIDDAEITELAGLGGKS